MNNDESKIIQTLSARAAEPSREFAEKLRRDLLKRENKAIKQRKRVSMKSKKLQFSLAGLLLIAGMAAVVLISMKNEKKELTVQTPNEQSTTQASSLPSQLVDDVDDPLASLSFTPLQPTILLAQEVPQQMKAGTSNGMVDDSDTLYMPFADDTGVLYKIIQTTKTGNYPDDTQAVSVTVLGKKYTANYYQVSEEIDNTGLAPSSYLFWTDGKINFQISEFGRVQLEDLIRLANSLK